MRALALLLTVTTTVACGTTRDDPSHGPPDSGLTLVDTDPLSGLPTGVEQWAAMCAKHYGDMISTKFCAGTAPPPLGSLADLEALLGLTVVANPNNDPTLNTNVRITLNGESTGLGLRKVNPITPRAFLMTPPVAGQPNPRYQVLSFARGEPLVELVANDPTAQTLRFFLIRFHPACEPNCNFADLQTASIESGWTSYTIYDDQTINNTTLDCLACHQPKGTDSQKMMRMQELQNPWAHWFYPERPETLAIVQAFQAAHPNEDYAGIPYQNVYPSRPASLMQLVQNNGFGTQPNVFDTLTINTQRAQTGSSPAWNQLYDQAVAGEEIPAPYFTSSSDPTKLQAATTAYLAVTNGSLARDQMPDVEDTIADNALSDRSIRPKPGLDGPGILKHICQKCHNSRLDQSISRARFNVETFDQLSREEKDAAIARLQLDPADRHAMPPQRFHQLSDAERDLVIHTLAQ